MCTASTVLNIRHFKSRASIRNVGAWRSWCLHWSFHVMFSHNPIAVHELSPNQEPAWRHVGIWLRCSKMQSPLLAWEGRGKDCSSESVISRLSSILSFQAQSRILLASTINITCNWKGQRIPLTEIHWRSSNVFSLSSWCFYCFNLSSICLE